MIENPFEPPRERELLQTSAYRDHENLVVNKDAELPQRCVVCNGPAYGAPSIVPSNQANMGTFFVWFIPVCVGYIVVQSLLTKGSLPVARGWHECLVRAALLVGVASIPLTIQSWHWRYRFGFCHRHFVLYWIRQIGVIGLMAGLIVTELGRSWPVHFEIVERVSFCISMVFGGLFLLALIQFRFRPKAIKRLGSHMWIGGCGEEFLESLLVVPDQVAFESNST